MHYFRRFSGALLLVLMLLSFAACSAEENEPLPELADCRISLDELKDEDRKFSFTPLCESDEDGSPIRAVAIGADGSAAVYAGWNIFVHTFDGQFLYGCRVEFSNEHYRNRLFYSKSGKLCYPASYTASQGNGFVVLVFADDLSTIEACYRLDDEKDLENCARFVQRSFEKGSGTIWTTTHPDSAYLINDGMAAKLVLQYRNTNQTFVAYDHQAEYEQNLETRRPMKYVGYAGMLFMIFLAVGWEILKRKKRREEEFE